MEQRARANESLFRRSGGRREALSHPNEGGTHVHYQPHHRVGLGSITSRPSSDRPHATFWELLAAQLGVDIQTAMRLHEEGKTK